ncbi:MAG: DNA-protecting protein DprA [Lachnospiraceae bacterium]|nr:DNA-protecting protein DprA [Lachnospiraceae bacterium]
MSYEILSCQKGDGLYLKRFMERKGLPEKFFYKGDISFLNDLRAVAVIGSRNAPKDSILNAYMSGQYAAMEGFDVVNGLAVGCDTAALRGALSEGGRCVAVLPCGLDMVVPSVNEYLAQEILEKGGCLISEYAEGTEPEKYRYVQRDRLQSGLSEAVLIVHYGEDSGSLKTAEFARKQGVKVLRYQGSEKNEGDLLPYVKTLIDPEAFRAFLKNYKPGEAIVYEQMKLPFL